MTYQPHDLANLNLAGKYFNQLATDDISRRHYSGQKYATSLTSRFQFFFATESKLSELAKFYPYQPLVTETVKLYNERKHKNNNYAFGFSSLSILTVYQLAKQNVVLPALSKFGKFFKTHRLLRQYLWLAVLPYAFGFVENNLYFLNQTQKLWIVHAERLNNKILSDPLGSQYPREILPISQVGAWYLPFVHKADKPRKWQNQTHIGLAADYTDVDEWQKVPIPVNQEGQGGQDAGSDGAEQAGAAEQEQ